MATLKDKPKGYYEFILAMDCETSGLAVNNDDPSYNASTGEEYQSVSWGMIVASADTLKPVEKLYVEIQWNGDAVWDGRAEKVHGLSKKHLEEKGLTEEEAVEEIANFIIKYWGTDVSIRTLGHNVASFDLWFLKRLMRRHGIELKFGNRHVDTSSIGFVNWRAFTSDQLFEAVGFDERGAHNALDDAMMSLESARRTRMVFESILDD